MFVNTRIYHECEGGIDKSVPSITVWSYEVCTVMTTDNPEGQIFPILTQIVDSFSCSSISLTFLFQKSSEKLYVEL